MENDVLILLGVPHVGLTPIFGLLMKSDIHTSAKFSVCTFPDSKTPLFLAGSPSNVVIGLNLKQEGGALDV